MPCKICGKPIKGEVFGAGVALSYIKQPTCRCFWIRKHIRIKGCPKCHAHGTEIQLKKGRFLYHVICTCGHTWTRWRPK